MHEVPFSGRIDVALACLLVVERHGSVARHAVTRDEIAADVLAVVDVLEVDPLCLRDLDAFEVEIERALLRLDGAGWIETRLRQGPPQFGPRPVAEDVVAWVRSRLRHDPVRTAAFERLDRAVTARVAATRARQRPSRGAAHRA